MKTINYDKLLIDGFQSMQDCLPECGPENRLQYLSDHIFDFTTYDDDVAELFATKALEIVDAITSRTTFEYIKKSEDNYRWYLLMCNMPFFSKRLDWGSSIRGAWWADRIRFSSCGLSDGEDQITETLDFTKEEWEDFMRSILSFATQSQ